VCVFVCVCLCVCVCVCVCVGDLIQVSVPDATSYSIFIPHCVASDHGRILQLLSVTCGRDADDHTATTTSNYSFGASTDGTGDLGYLVLVQAGRLEDDGGDDWQGGKVKIDLTGDTAIAVSHMEVYCFTLQQ